MKHRSLIALIGLTIIIGLFTNSTYADDSQTLVVDDEISRVVSSTSFKSLGTNDNFGLISSTEDISIESAYEAAIVIKKQQEEQEALHEEWVAMNGDGLLGIENPDPNYNGQVVVLDAANRNLLERLVMGEAGGEGVIGAALVAQAIHDTMIKDNNFDVNNIRITYKYSGRIDREPNDNVKEAVSIVFDQGGYAVKHRIIYFYAPALCVSSWHESQIFVVEYGGHRVFDRR